jgi:hypothetical protein
MEAFTAMYDFAREFIAYERITKTFQRVSQALNVDRINYYTMKNKSRSFNINIKGVQQYYF